MGGRIRTMEICKQALGGRCTRGADECKFAHVTKDGHVTINPDNTVTICRESLSDKCQRETCKFWHPPAHLRDSASAVCDMAKSRMRGGMGGGRHMPAPQYGMGDMGGRPMVSMQGSEMDIRAELQQIQQQEMGLQQQKQQIAQQEQMLMQRKQQLLELLGGGTPQQPPLMQQPAAPPYPQYGEPPVQQYHEPPVPQYREHAPRGGSSVEVCKDFIVGRCTRATCRFSHDEELVRSVKRGRHEQ